MKKIVLLTLLLTAALYSNAQRGKDVLYLKNGSVIRGTVLELEPEGNVRIRTADGSVFVYPTADVEKLEKDANERQAPRYSDREGVRYSSDGVEANTANRQPRRRTDDAGISASAQESAPEVNRFYRRGYIGVSLGASIPVGTFANNENHLTAANAGVHIGLVNFGYLFTKHVGIHASLNVGINNYEANGWDFDPNFYKSYPNFYKSDWGEYDYDHYGLWSYCGLQAGPLFSWQLGERFHFDMRPSIGIASVSLPFQTYDNDFYGYDTDGHAFFAMGLGSSLRFDVARPIALMLNLDYLNIARRSGILPYNLQTVNISLGVAVKFKK